MSAVLGHPKQARTAARQGEGTPVSAALGRPKQANAPSGRSAVRAATGLGAIG